ncbi:MAG: HD domain-containing protein [Bacillota bacterium]
MKTREEALNLLKEYNKNESLVKHALAVEAVMRRFARLRGYDEEYWGIVGLLHDVDYERYPEQHCLMSRELLVRTGYDEAFVHAVMSHGYGLCTDVAPEHPMEKVLYTIDELTGLIAATVYMRPSRSILDLESKSVLKKFKQASFAAGVNREIIAKGCEMLDMELASVIGECIEGMKPNAEELGLLG